MYTEQASLEGRPTPAAARAAGRRSAVAVYFVLLLYNKQV